MSISNIDKIREKVVEMVNSINPFIPDEDGKNSDYEAGKLDATTQILQIIDSFEEPVSEDLEKASKEWLRPQLDKSYADYGETKMMELTHFDGYAMLDAIEFGAKWGKNQAKVEIQAQSMAFAHGCPEEPVSEDLREAARKYFKSLKDYCFISSDIMLAFKAGAKWQEEKDNEEKVLIYKHGFDDCKEQFEKNRLAACDRQTGEEAEIEQSFVMGIIEKEHRQPTFNDAIKYGMRLKEQLLMANTADATIGLPYENKYGGYTHLVDVSRPLPVGNNKIAIIFKEDSV